MEPDGQQVPSIKPTIFDAEQAKAFALACADQNLQQALPPVNIADLLKTLKVMDRICNHTNKCNLKDHFIIHSIFSFQTFKNLVSNHTIYTTNVERLHTYATHLTWEDLEMKPLLCPK